MNTDESDDAFLQELISRLPPWTGKWTAEKATPRMFVAGTRDGLETCHVIVRDVLLSLGWEPVQESDWQEDGARERLRERISNCKAVLYLVGECFGPQVPQGMSDQPCSFAQLEFNVAWELDKPICIFLFGDDFPFDSHEPERSDRQALQREHRAALCSDDKRCVHVRDKGDLAERLRDVLRAAKSSRSNARPEFAARQRDLSDEPLSSGPSEANAVLAPATPAAFQESVQFTAYRPRVIPPDDWTKMLVFAHLADRPQWLNDSELRPIEEMEQEAERILGSKIDDCPSSTSDSLVAIPQDGEITIVPEIAGIEFNPQRRVFPWKDDMTVRHESFDMRANASVKCRLAWGRMTIFLGRVILAEITLSISVGRVEQPVSAFCKSSSARLFRRVFTSYSRRDMQIVETTERYGRTLGNEYIRDLANLRSGESWNDQLRELVHSADVFQLFWSSNAAHSKYVEEEWRYALSLNRPNFVRPTYWQEPMPQPPEPLRGLHFHRLISEMQPEVLPPSISLEHSKNPDEPSWSERAQFMPSSAPGDDSGRALPLLLTWPN